MSLLKGCWALGHEVPAVLSDNAGKLIDHGTTRAGKLCFDAAGHGRRTTENDFPHAKLVCNAPVTAHFTGENTLATQQPVVACSNGKTRWTDHNLTCKRRDDNTADCVNDYGIAMEFRRES